MTVTLKDVAKRAGVSIPTVSLIINGHNLPFKESTRRAVLEAVEALNYRPDSMARRNANGSNRRDAVALLLRSESWSRVANTPVYEFICGVNDVCMEHNQFLVMMKLSQLQQTSENGSPRLIAERFVDGLIVETGLPPELELAVARYRIPTIWLNSNHHDPSDCIYPDEVHAGKTVTDHLIGLGHRGILFVGPVGVTSPTPHFSIADRQRGYEQAMVAHQLTPRFVYERATPDPASKTGSTFSDVSDAIEAVMKSRQSAEPITAVITYDFTQAAKVRGELQSLGLHCPQDVSIATTNDLRFLRRNWPEMTGFTCDRYHMGCQAAEMMLAKISSGGHPQPSQVWRGDLIPGQTVAPPPGGDAAPSSKKQLPKKPKRQRSTAG